MSVIAPNLTDDFGTDPTSDAIGTTLTTPRSTLLRLVVALKAGTWVRPTVVIGSIVASYHTSLRSLLDGLNLDTPIAHLALVPCIALVVALGTRHDDAGPDIHDRQLDWIVGLPLVIGALLANLILPARLSAQFWLWRVDLLTMPFFAAGVVSLVYGVRSMWRMRFALLFLFLAWPYPYNLALTNWLGKFTDLTVAGVTRAQSVVHLAKPLGVSSSLFQISHAGKDFTLSVASACSGANGFVGFLLVGIAFSLMVDGARWRKMLWLLIGVVLVWLLNIARINVVFWAAKAWGQKVAIDGFHPFVGLLAFTLGVAVMVLSMGWFGLRFRSIDSKIRARQLALTSQRHHLPNVRLAAGFVVLATIGVATLNSGLENNDLVSTSLGTPRLASFADSKETPTDWSLQTLDTYDWSKQFFGKSSNWTRYQYLSSTTSPSELSSSTPIVADIIDTPDRSALNSYGVEACYHFHGYKVTGVKSVDLGGGVVGDLLTWTLDTGKSHATYTTLYWHWPIKTARGTSYERVTLIVTDRSDNSFASPAQSSGSFAEDVGIKANDALRSAGNDETVTRLLQTRQFLVAFGKNMIQQRKPAAV
jgi:exosortase/archaeosortase family protein